jgi:DNA-directed RNA polymerase specialized sigma24 family protein
MGIVVEQYPGTLTEGEGYNLFRRAIVEHDEDAWTECFARYGPLLVAWASSHSAIGQLSEHCDDIAVEAFARAWAALSPQRFAAFPSLAALLAYLRTCVLAAIIDCVRAQTASQRMMQRLEGIPPATPEQIVLDKIARAELWHIANGLVKTLQERTILIEHFMLGLPPRTIWARHRDLFADVSMVYVAKRNLLTRHQHNPDLLRLCREALSAYIKIPEQYA